MDKNHNDKNENEFFGIDITQFLHDQDSSEPAKKAVSSAVHPKRKKSVSSITKRIAAIDSSSSMRLYLTFSRSFVLKIKSVSTYLHVNPSRLIEELCSEDIDEMHNKVMRSCNEGDPAPDA